MPIKALTGMQSDIGVDRLNLLHWVMTTVRKLQEKGEGELAVYRYIKSNRRNMNSYRSMQKVKDICNQVSYQELIDIGEIWVEAAMSLTSRELKVMARLIRSQDKMAKTLVKVAEAPLEKSG